MGGPHRQLLLARMSTAGDDGITAGDGVPMAGTKRNAGCPGMPTLPFKSTVTRNTLGGINNTRPTAGISALEVSCRPGEYAAVFVQVFNFEVIKIAEPGKIEPDPPIAVFDVGSWDSRIPSRTARRCAFSRTRQPAMKGAEGDTS